MENRILNMSFKMKENFELDEKDLEFEEYYLNMVENKLEVSDLTKGR